MPYISVKKIVTAFNTRCFSHVCYLWSQKFLDAHSYRNIQPSTHIEAYGPKIVSIECHRLQASVNASYSLNTPCSKPPLHVAEQHCSSILSEFVNPNYAFNSISSRHSCLPTTASTQSATKVQTIDPDTRNTPRHTPTENKNKRRKQKQT